VYTVHKHGQELRPVRRLALRSGRQGIHGRYVALWCVHAGTARCFTLRADILPSDSHHMLPARESGVQVRGRREEAEAYFKEAAAKPHGQEDAEAVLCMHYQRYSKWASAQVRRGCVVPGVSITRATDLLRSSPHMTPGTHCGNVATLARERRVPSAHVGLGDPFTGKY
jgi:hypothetical protein